ncbi:MAG: class I SAM-dependent methyltransferase [Rhodobiaceae bacterium]|nr:class I SAM-dependent methyltransferase [Rhodobiaceae bacterium]
MASSDDLIARGFLPYNDEAPKLRTRYAELHFAERHKSFRFFFPEAPANVLDIGAGVGVDARGFAELGHKVVAAEPADAMRAVAIEDRDHENITWVDDCLPNMDKVKAMGLRFDFALASASFMHLPEDRQAEGFLSIASLMKPEGHVAMSLRHGPVPDGRTMYELSPDDAAKRAAAAGLVLVRHEEKPDRTGRPGVSWSMMVFEKP